MMRALQFDGEVKLVKRPQPQRAQGEVRVRLLRAGVCDTDLQLCRGYLGFRGTLGHEAVGVVVDGDEDQRHWFGKRVVVDINAGCGTCGDCVQSDGHHCPTRTVLGIVGRDGVFADEFVMPATNLVFVPDSVSDDCAVFAEPLAAALHVLQLIEGEARGTHAIVLGDGKLGLLIALALLGAGVQTSVLGRHEHKLELARAAGAVTHLAPQDGPLPTLERAPLVVEATGSAHGLALALSLAAPRGTIALKTTVSDKLQVDLAPVVIHELKIVGSRCGSLPAAIACLAERRVDPRPLIAARFPLDQGPAALAHAATRGTLKVLLEA